MAQKDTPRQDMGRKSMGENEQTTKPPPADRQGRDQPGMMGDGTREQNLNRPADKDARLTQDRIERDDRSR